MSKAGAKVVIVDKHDTPVGIKLFENMQYEDIYRVVALWLTDTATGDMLMAQRKWTKVNNPGQWACATAGTIEEGDEYDSHIVHEIKEETGLTGLALIKGPKQFVDDGAHKFFCQWYFASVDKDKTTIKVEEDAVEQIRWISPKALMADIEAHPETYTPAIRETLRLLGVGNA